MKFEYKDNSKLLANLTVQSFDLGTQYHLLKLGTQYHLLDLGTQYHLLDVDI